MADDTSPAQHRDDRGGRPGAGRPPGNREPGGFRIRLSDNEMRAARAIQESFGLRSTVAALGFAIRTVAQLLEDGQLDELVAQQRAQGGNRPSGGRSERRPAGGEGRGARPERGPRIDPFARPSRPPAPQSEAEASPDTAAVETPAADQDAAVIEPVESISMASPDAGDASAEPPSAS